jgi:hypothetical protein
MLQEYEAAFPTQCKNKTNLCLVYFQLQELKLKAPTGSIVLLLFNARKLEMKLLEPSSRR